MIQFFENTSVVSLGATALTKTVAANEAYALNVYNAAVVTRNVTITAGVNVFSIPVASGATISVFLVREGNLSIVADGTGVFGWLSRRTAG